MIVMTYVGDRVDWAIMIARELETDVFYGYRLPCRSCFPRKSST